MWIELWTLLLQHELLLYIVIGIVALIFGSFFNVVIYRLPLMLYKEWKEQCQEIQSTKLPALPDFKNFNLLIPHSHCTICKTPIKPWDNIPIISFLLLKGRSRCCNKKIAKRYPIIESLTLLFTLITLLCLGLTTTAFFAVLLTWALLVLCFIDFDHQILPDQITLTFLWLGLLVNITNSFVTLQDAVIGAIAGYLFLWSITIIFKLFTGKVGMGHGDFKLTAMLGAWLGWSMLPLIIFLSALVGSIIGLLLIVSRRLPKDKPIPFGPFLAIAGWVALMWGNTINAFYLQWFFYI